MILTSLWAIPVAGALLTLALSALNLKARWIAIIVAALEMGVTLAAGSGFGSGHFVSVIEAGKTLTYGIRYSFFMDGLSWSLCLLNAFLTMIALISSWKQDLSAGFWASFLFLEGAVTVKKIAVSGIFFQRPPVSSTEAVDL